MSPKRSDMAQEKSTYAGPEPVHIGDLGRIARMLVHDTLEYVQRPGVATPEAVGYAVFSAALGASAVCFAGYNSAKSLLSKVGR